MKGKFLVCLLSDKFEQQCLCKGLPNRATGTQSARTNSSFDEKKLVDVENCAARISSSLGLDIFGQKN